MNYHYITDFYKERKNKIGSSDILYCIPHPIKTIEGIGAFTDNNGQRHPQTAIDLFEKKINNEKSEYSFAAEMGNFIEVKAIYEFIKDNISEDEAFNFQRGYLSHKMVQDLKSYKANKYVCENPESYNTTAFLHNTKSDNEYASVHADCIYDPERSNIKEIKKVNNLIIDLSKSFIIESKTANYFSVMKRQKDQYRGYDLSLTGFQGIDLGHYFQIQYQMLVYGIDTAFLSLIYNTNSKHYWMIKANPDHQKDLKQIAIYMKKCLDEKIPPKQLAMNSHDIKYLYSEINEDFREIKDAELTEIIQTAKKYIEAKEQEKNWKQQKEEYEEKMSIHLKDTKVLKGNIGDRIIDIARWKETGGAERVIGLKDILEREDGKTITRYLKKKGLIKKDKENRKPNIILKEKDLEGWEENGE
jgi:hypothetical protein